MKVITFLLSPVLGTFLVIPVWGMEAKGLTSSYEAQHSSMAGTSHSLLGKFRTGIKNKLSPKKDLDQPVKTLGQVALDCCRKSKKNDKDKSVQIWANEVDNLIKQSLLLYQLPGNWHEVVQKGSKLWETNNTNSRDELTILGLLEKLQEVARIDMHVLQRAVKDLPDELVLKLKTVREYPRWFSNLLLQEYKIETHPIKAPSEVKECWERAKLIGSHRKIIEKVAPALADREIDRIIRTYLMEARLPNEEKDIACLIYDMRVNLRGMFLDSLEGKYSIGILSHLSMYPSDVRTRLLELKNTREFWEDMFLPFARQYLITSSKYNQESTIYGQENRRMADLLSQPWTEEIRPKLQPSDEILRALINSMEESINSKEFTLPREIYRLLSIHFVYSAEVEDRISELLFSGDHVPDYIAELWSNSYPGLVVTNNLLCEFQKIMIYKKQNYFLDAKRYVLAQRMENLDGGWFASLVGTLRSLKVKQTQEISADYIKMICGQIFHSLQYTGDDLLLRKHYALSLEALLRVMEYDIGSIDSILQYLDREPNIRSSFCAGAKHLINTMTKEEEDIRAYRLYRQDRRSFYVDYLEKESALPGFFEALILAFDELWPKTVPLDRVNEYRQIVEDTKEERSEKFKKATLALKYSVIESGYF